MASLLGFLGALGDAANDGQPTYLTRLNDAADPAAAAERAQAKQIQQTQSALANYQQSGGRDPLMVLNILAQGSPEFAGKLAEYQIKYGQPDWKTAEVDGALVRYNANDPNSKPEIIYGTNGGKPQTNVAKLKSDLDAGRIDQGTYERALAKEVAPTEKNYKQFQLQNAGFADRMVNSASILDPYEAKMRKGEFTPVNKISAALSSIPSFGAGEALGNSYLSEDQQKYKNAQSEWVRAKLRKESGAAIGVKEMEDEIKTYFPQVGDKPEVIKQKAELRKVATDSMIKQTSGAYDDMYGSGDTGAVSNNIKPSSQFRDGQTATGANGQKIIFRGGKWSPL